MRPSCMQASTKGVHIGAVVRIPCSVFPEEAPTSTGYWVGKTVKTRLGGKKDIGIRCDGEDFVFTRPITEVAKWVVAA